MIKKKFLFVNYVERKILFLLSIYNILIYSIDINDGVVIIKNPYIIYIDIDTEKIKNTISHISKTIDTCIHNKKNEKIIIGTILIGIYILFSYTCNKFAKKIIHHTYYKILCMKENEMKLIIKKKKLLSIKDIIKIKELYNNIQNIFNYYYFYLFFSFVPFFHNDLKQIIFGIKFISNNVEKIELLIQ